MGLFKRKPKKVIESKFHDGEYVRFRYRGELTTGWIYNIYENEGGVIYDIQIGGQCPAILYGFKEEQLTSLEKKN